MEETQENSGLLLRARRMGLAFFHFQKVSKRKKVRACHCWQEVPGLRFETLSLCSPRPIINCDDRALPIRVRYDVAVTPVAGSCVVVPSQLTRRAANIKTIKYAR